MDSQGRLLCFKTNTRHNILGMANFLKNPKKILAFALRVAFCPRDTYFY